MTEKTENQLVMSEFVQRWKEAGSPLDRDWYELFMKLVCLNLEHRGACWDGYCPMGDDECSKLVSTFS